MPDTIIVQRDPMPPAVALAVAEKVPDPPSPDPPKEGETPTTERDPILDLVQRLQTAASVLGERDPGLVKGINQLAVQASEPGRAGQPQFRTHVAYALQDMEKIVGAGSTAMPAELRVEMTRLAATSPGLENRQMEALVHATPDLADRGLVRDVRRAAAIVAGLGANQNTPEVREQVEVLENRVLLAPRPAVQSGAGANSAERPASERFDAERPASQTIEPRPSSVGARPAAEEQGQPAAEPTTAGEKIRTVASPGGGNEKIPVRMSGQEKAQGVAERDAPDLQQRRQNTMGSILDKMRAPAPNAPPPWDVPTFNMTGRISHFEKALADGKTDQLIRASEKSGQALMQAVETFMTGPGAGVLAKVEVAASTEAGGMQAVMSGMQPGGKYAALRSEFDNALQQDRVFAAAYSQVERTGAQYGRDRLALGANYAARKLDATQLDVRFQEADASVGEATSKIPGRTPGKSVMDELGEKLAEVFSKAAERVKQMFGREMEREPRASFSPGMRP